MVKAFEALAATAASFGAFVERYAQEQARGIEAARAATVQRAEDEARWRRDSDKRLEDDRREQARDRRIIRGLTLVIGLAALVEAGATVYQARHADRPIAVSVAPAPASSVTIQAPPSTPPPNVSDGVDCGSMT